MNVVCISPASSTEDLRALQEVKDFASTDMDMGSNVRWTYRILSEGQIMPELSRLARPETRAQVDCVSFQPCTSYDAASQDRYVVEPWNLPGGRWTFSGVFDGHCGHETVDYTCRYLPAVVRKSMEALLSSRSGVDPDRIAQTLGRAISNFDDSITSDFLASLTSGADRLDTRQLRVPMVTGDVSKVIRCARGTTALLTLVDPRQERLWVANLGDCQAVLVSKSSGDTWQGTRLNQLHNGSNEQELRRIMNKHPGEGQCILDRRVLGFLAPTRVVGDTWMKLPALYSRNIFMNLKDRWSIHMPNEAVDRILTPPYLSNTPDVYFHRLRKSRCDPIIDVALLLCSDGLPDLYDNWTEQEMLTQWARLVGQGCRLNSGGGRSQNVALCLLRDAIGGDDIHRVSRNLTVEMEERWMDDTTILVHRFL